MVLKKFFEREAHRAKARFANQTDVSDLERLSSFEQEVVNQSYGWTGNLLYIGAMAVSAVVVEAVAGACAAGITYFSDYPDMALFGRGSVVGVAVGITLEALLHPAGRLLVRSYVFTRFEDEFTGK